MSVLAFFRGLPPHLQAAGSNWFARIATVAIQLMSLPLLTRSLGDERFAVYAIANSLLSWYLLLDPGIGNATQNFISERRARSMDPDQYLASALAMMGVLVLIALALPLVIAPLAASVLFSRIGSIASAGGVTVLIVSGVGFVGSVLGAVCAKILYATDRGVRANMITLSVNVASFLLLVASLSLLPREYWLIAAVAAYALPMGIAGMAVGLWIYFQIPRQGRRIEAAASGAIIRRGLAFWPLAIAGALVFNLDYVILSRSVEPAAITEYNALQKILGTVMIFYGGLVGATWPYWAKSLASGEGKTVKRDLRRYIGGGVLTVVSVTVALIVAQGVLFSILMPNSTRLSSSLTIALFGLFVTSRVWTDTYATVLLARSDMSPFLYYTPVQAVLSVTLQLLLVRWFGLDGLLAGMTLAALLTAVWILPLRASRYLR